MASFFTLTLDTTAPATPTITLAGGAAYTSARAITAAINSASGTPTQMKIWGSVDTTINSNIQATEGASAWIAYNTSQSITLSTGDGLKTINVKVRDAVRNESTLGTDQITLDTTVPVITISGPDVATVSKVAGADTASFSFTTDLALQAYKVKVVPTTGSLQDAGTQIPSTAGSTNMSGGAVSAAGTVNCAIKGADLESASATDGDKIVKVFGQESGTGDWSV